MRTYGVDWGHGDKTCYHTESGPVEWDGSLIEFIEAHAPCRIVIESTFESFLVEEKNRTIDVAEAMGCVLSTVSGRTTANYRARLGREKSDTTDAEVIYRIWKDGKVHLTKPRRSPVRDRTPLEEIELLRHRKWPKEDVKKYLQFLPDKKEFPQEVLEVLGPPTKTNAPILLPLIGAALQSETRQEFDKTIGSYGSGYPNYIRSNLYYHKTDALVKRMRSDHLKSLNEARKKAWDEDRKADYRALTSQLEQEERANLKACMRSLRRMTRWVYHQVKDRMGNVDPEMGK